MIVKNVVLEELDIIQLNTNYFKYVNKFKSLEMNRPFQKIHPYQRNNNNNNNTDNYRNTIKCLIRKDGLSAEYFIHPYSLHHSDSNQFAEPKEIGVLLSESIS